MERQWLVINLRSALPKQVNHCRSSTVVHNVEGGEYGLAFALGMAALSTTMLSLVPLGGHIVSSDSIYNGAEKLHTTRPTTLAAMYG